MPQLQNVVLKDRKSTPVDHTFTPKDIVDGVATVVETTGVPVGNSRLSLSLRETNGNGGRYKAQLKLAVPVVATEVINGVSSPKVVRTAYADVTFTFDQTSSEAERNDLVGMLADALASTKVLVNDTVVKLQNVY
jgi:hypothetical protein